MGAPTKPYRAWRGALELVINDVPLAVNVELYSRVKKTRNDSFVNLAPSGQPRSQKSVDPATGKPFEESQIRKAVKVGSGKDAKLVPLTDQALERIKEGQSTKTIRPEAFCPRDTIAWDLAIDRFAVRPNDEVQGAGDALNIVWNGLRASGLVWQAQVALTGGHDAILCIYADEVGMWAALLPFEEELYPLPTHGFEENAQAATLFGQMVEQEHEVGPFDHARWVSEYRPRRQAAIDAVIAGQPVEAAPEPTKDSSGPDLMSLLEASVQKGKKRAPAKKRAAKKVPA